MTQLSVFAQQNDTTGQIIERKSELRCVSEEVTRISRDIAREKNRVAELLKTKIEKEQERDAVSKQIEAVSGQIDALKKQLEEEKKKTGTDEYKEALDKLRKPIESALENFKAFKDAMKTITSEMEALEEATDDIGIQLKIQHTCKICMCSKDKWVSFDCGHIFCQECAALKSDKCAFCNKPIESWHEVYLP